MYSNGKCVFWSAEPIFSSIMRATKPAT